MAQTIFSQDINAYCRKFFVTRPGAPEPSAAEAILEMDKLQRSLFENLLLFDKLAVKIEGEAIAVPLLIRLFGERGFDALIEEGALEFVLWTESIAFLVNNIPGVDGMVSMAHSNPVYIDPERSIESGLSWMQNAPTGRKRRQLVERVLKRFRSHEKNIAANGLKVVRAALANGDLEHYGVPKVTGHADQLTATEKQTLARCAEDLVEYDFLLKNNMTSFSNYRYFSPFWASAERFQAVNRTVSGFSSVSTLEGIPDLKQFFGEIEYPLKRVHKVRGKASSRRFRGWLEKTAGGAPEAGLVPAYLDAISDQQGVLNTTSGKILKNVLLAAVGTAGGTAASEAAGASVGIAAGAATMLAAQKGAETVAASALGLLDSFLLERVAKGWSPRMFFDDLSKLKDVSTRKRP